MSGLRGISSTVRRCLSGNEGNQLVELAVALPLLMALVVGIFDFGSAYNLKQKLNDAARAAARFASTEPTLDLPNASGTPNSVTSVRNMVDDYLTAAGINDCSLLRQGGANISGYAWQFTANGNNCPGGQSLTLTIDRSFAVPIATTPTINVISTHVTISYPYSWQYGSVFGLLSPSANFNGTSLITTEAIVPNMD